MLHLIYAKCRNQNARMHVWCVRRFHYKSTHNSTSALFQIFRKQSQIKYNFFGSLTSDALVATELMLVGDIADSGLAFDPNALFLLLGE